MNNSTARGAYSLQVFEGDELIRDTGEFDNLITHLALTMGAPFESGVLCIGIGRTAPAVSNVSLEEEVAAESSSFGNASTIFMKGEDRYSKRSITATFTGIDGDISEVGFRDAAIDSVRSRSLVRDGNGLVTIIPIKPEQTLKITYFVYVLIPEVMATGTVTTPYGSSSFTIKPHADLVNPAGIFAGKFNNPFEGSGLKAILTSGSVSASVFTWSYDSATRTATATVNYVATELNRTFEGFEAATNAKNLPIIELDSPLINPAQNDCSFTLSFTWDRA
jgi:hypothetical protein